MSSEWLIKLQQNQKQYLIFSYIHIYYTHSRRFRVQAVWSTISKIWMFKYILASKPTARERLGKESRNKYSTNNRGHPVLGNGHVFSGISSTQQNQSDISTIKEEGFTWRFVFSYSNLLWLRVILKEWSINSIIEFNYRIQTPSYKSPKRVAIFKTLRICWHFLKSAYIYIYISWTSY